MAAENRMQGDEATAGGVQRLDAPLHGVAALLDALEKARGPVEPVALAPAAASGAIAAQDVRAPGAVPALDVALADGWAASSADLIGASSMSPAMLMGKPHFVSIGDPLSAGCDCVIDRDLVSGAHGVFEAQGSAAPGDGVRRAGEDLRAGDVLVRAGERILHVHVLALEAAGFGETLVRRPRLRVMVAPPAAGEPSTARMIAALAGACGAQIEYANARGRDAASLAEALTPGGCDAIFMVGGSGAGADDHAVAALRMRGRVIAHGIAIEPGRTGAAGFAGDVPVLCVPGRFDAALAVALSLALPLLRRLAGARDDDGLREAPLTRKIASSVGVSQIVLLEAAPEGWAPLAVGDITLSHMLRANAWMLIPEASEGLAEGAPARPRPLPGRRED